MHKLGPSSSTEAVNKTCLIILGSVKVGQDSLATFTRDGHASRHHFFFFLHCCTGTSRQHFWLSPSAIVETVTQPWRSLVNLPFPIYLVWSPSHIPIYSTTPSGKLWPILVPPPRATTPGASPLHWIGSNSYSQASQSAMLKVPPYTSHP